MIQKNWQDLIKPNKLEVKHGSDPSRMATVVAEPLERGFGLTLGNALRRVLLSSLQGAAVTSVQIDGVLHEFSSIAGVREDVTDIVLNIKEIAIKMEGEGPKRMTLRKSGPSVVTAGDIQTVGDIEILNPELVIRGLIMTMYDSRTNLSRQVVEEVRRHFKDNVFRTIIPRSVRLSEAPSHGLPVGLYAPNSSGAVAYRLLAAELLNGDRAPENSL